jgi:GGDEF domain-containing protein
VAIEKAPMTIGRARDADFEAPRLADRVRRSVEGLQMSARGEVVRLATSVGAAALTQVEPNDDPVAALLALADARRFGAKASGRHRAQTLAARLLETAARHAGAR